jgi:hypothetical protein
MYFFYSIRSENMNKDSFLKFAQLCFFLLSSVSITYGANPIMVLRTDVHTPKTNSTVQDVYECTSGDYTQAEKDQAKNAFQINYPNATFLSDATYTYNCHSFAWNTVEGGPLRWIGWNTKTAENIYWNEGSYIQVDAAYKAEKVSYPEINANHSTIETTDLSNEIFDSKWGAWVQARHTRNYCPYSPTSPVVYYARYVRNIANTTLTSNINRRYTAVGSLTVSNTTINSGAKVDLVSDADVTISSITIQNGSTVNISVY